jgi:hypothetical protein
MRMQRKSGNYARRKGIFSLYISSITLTDYSFSKSDGWERLGRDPLTYLTKALERRYGGLQGEYPLILAKSSEHKVLRTKAEILSTMYD